MNIEGIRFVADHPFRKSENTPEDSPASEIYGVPADLLHSSVLICQSTFPRLYEILCSVTQALSLAPDFANFLIRRSHEIQAVSIAFKRGGKSAVLLTSSLVERLSDKELAFVIGHEIGHVIFRHNRLNLAESKENGIIRLRQLALKRASEISADRVGLIASEDVSFGVSSLIKTVTGLDERNVRFDIQAFLQQYKHILEYGPSPLEAASTHPLFLVRIRALLLFSQTAEFSQLLGRDKSGRIHLSEIDKRITRDLKKISGLEVQDIENILVQKALILAAFIVFAADGKLAQDEQEFLKETLGEVEYKDIVPIIHEKGMQGLIYEFNIAIQEFGNASSQTKDKITTFIQELIRSFPEEHTVFLKDALLQSSFTSFIDIPCLAGSSSEVHVDDIS